jgi:hypothetical protein
MIKVAFALMVLGLRALSLDGDFIGGDNRDLMVVEWIWR